MDLIKLPGERLTTRLGFGTSGLHGGLLSRAQSLRLLETAFDAGIRHYDTAPMYGLGYSEAIVGEFLAAHRHDVTVTTKFGLRPPPARHFWEFARAVAKPLVRLAPGIKRHLVKAIPRTDAPRAAAGDGPYSVGSMLSSLEQSLRKLRTDRIDILLLHEGQACDLTDELQLALERLVDAGKIGGWGLGSARARVDAAIAGGHRLPVAQHEWSVLDGPPVRPGKLLVIHGTVGTFMRRIPGFSPDERQRWRDALGVELDAPEPLARALVGAALSANPGGIVLFSSKQPQHVRHIASLQAQMDKP